jgi:glucosyl-dolichyl phosphate glucuronosyltransferase
MTIRISVVIATLNRANYLRKALQSLSDQNMESSDYEVIVVDNGSTDNTKIIVEEFSRNPNFVYLFEPVVGLSKARNTGLKAATGDYVAYLDDDAIAHPAWLKNILSDFEKFTPIPGCIGGCVLPIWEIPQPDWLSDKMLVYLSLVSWSDIPTILQVNQGISGCNMAYSKEILMGIGGFREELGRHGRNLLSNEEVYVQQLLISKGFNIIYDPEIAVLHHIAAERLDKKWFEARVFWQGISKAFMLRIMQNLSNNKRILMSARKVLWVLPRMALIFTSPKASDRFRRFCQVREAFGFIYGLLFFEAG